VAFAGLATTSHAHEVFFYDVDHELVAGVANYVRAGLSDGEPVIVVATRAHLAAIDATLTRHGVDVSLARATGWYLALDAAETLETFLVDGSLDADRFRMVVGGMLDAAPGGGSVRAFGEMVALLWQEGNVTGAIALESLWNDLATSRQFSLLCAYPTAALGSAELADVNQVCQLHSAVLPPSSYGSAFSSGTRDGAATSSGVFVATPEAVAAARRFVSETLRSWGENRLVWDGALIMSELATNAIVHGGSPFRASVQRAARVVRIAVEDVGPGLPQSRRVAHDALGGRGMAIVEELAHRWGCDRLDGGKIFWAELESSSVRPG
jgi:anti-sigma regulatory factor (Ser/Thr protein kinase)